MLSASTAAGEDTESGIVENEHSNRGVIRKLSRTTRRLPGCEVYDLETNSWIFVLELDSLRDDGQQHAHKQWRILHGNNRETNCWCDTLPSGNWSNDLGSNDKEQTSTSISRFHTFTDRIMSDWWTSVEAGTGTWTDFLTVGSLCEVSRLAAS